MRENECHVYQECNVQQKCSIYLELTDPVVLWFVWFESAHRLPASAMFTKEFSLHKNLHSLKLTCNIEDDGQRLKRGFRESIYLLIIVIF